MRKRKQVSQSGRWQAAQVTRAGVSGWSRQVREEAAAGGPGPGGRGAWTGGGDSGGYVLG
jgi:hypothetical protein